MKISYTWLKRYLPDLQATPEELAETLPMLGFEVDEIQYTGVPPMPKVLVGQVIKKEQHPDADRLSVCQVNVGLPENLQIVCGATNFKEGDHVPVATIGAILPGDFKIKKSKLRGVTSMGMMCSPTELGLGADSKGLMILENPPQPGTPINDIFPDATPVLHLELTANRGDCASHLGIARELAAYYNLKLHKLASKKHEITTKDTNSLLKKVEISSENCPYYTAWTIKNVKIGPSPEWLIKDLEAVGFRPINNIVDITNWVLMHTGQPLHAFDLNKINDQKIIIRQATENEKITTLDEKERTLDPSITVIADAQKPLVIAGIMGSLDAEVDEATTDIILEAAYFNPENIKKTARKLNLHTDSSYRFSRNVDPEMILPAAEQAIEFILKLAGGEVINPAIVIGQAPRQAQIIELDPEFIRKTLGFHIENTQISNTFLALGFHVNADTTPWKITVPTFRADIHRPIDLVEEVLRLHGTKNIPQAPLLSKISPRNDSPIATFKQQAADYLTGQHFIETYHYSLRNNEEIETLFGENNAQSNKLENPLTTDHTHFRTSLIPGLLETVKHNHANYIQTPQLFEIGHTLNSINNTPYETITIALILETKTTERTWLQRSVPDFFSIKNLLLQITSIAKITTNSNFSHIIDAPLWQNHHSASIGNLETDKFQANLGLLNLKHTKSLDLPYPVLAAELHILPEFFKKQNHSTTFKPFNNFPPSTKDLALIVDKNLPAESIRKQLETWAKATTGEDFFVEKVTIFDVYQGQGLKENQKSLAFAITYQAQNRTLKDQEIMQAFDKLQEIIKADGKFLVRSE